MNKITLLRLIAVVAAIILIMAGVVAIVKNRDPQSEAGQTKIPGKLQVVATFYPIAEFARQIGGDKAQITTIVPTGTEPHVYEPTALAIANIQNADLFIYNGAGIEPWVYKVKLPKDEKYVIATDGTALVQVDPVEAKTSQHAITNNPHIWLDPAMAQQEVSNILDGYKIADPGNASYYSANAARYSKQLKDLDAAFTKGLEQCDNRFVIASHDMMIYLANHYDFTVQAISGLSPDDEPTPQKLAELTQFAREHNIGYIFYEDLVSPKLSETLAQETGAKTLVFSPLEGLSLQEQKESKNYLSMQQQNLQNLRTAMACK